MHQDRLVNTLFETTEPAKSSQDLKEATQDCISGAQATENIRPQAKASAQ